MNEPAMHAHLPVLQRHGPAMCRATVLLVALLLFSSCGSAPDMTIRLGTTKSEVNALILIAQERGYFAKSGVEVIHTIYPSGVAAINGLFDDEVDLATGSEFAFVGQALAGQEIRAISVINRSAIEYLVARVDRGIQTIGDLRGKIIGVPLGSRPEFALDRFLYFRGIDDSDVILVDVPVNRSADALASGEVDAVATWQPYVDDCREGLSSSLVVWSVQDDQPSYTLVMGRGDWVAGNAQPIGRFLAALVEAERWVAEDPKAARVFIADKWDYDPAYVQSVWPDHTWTVSLDQTLLVVMEDQARWIAERQPAGQARTSDLLPFIYFDGLEAVRPEAVNVIR